MAGMSDVLVNDAENAVSDADHRIPHGGLEISARGLRKIFDGGLFRALDGVDLEISAGERAAIASAPTGG